MNPLNSLHTFHSSININISQIELNFSKLFMLDKMFKTLRPVGRKFMISSLFFIIVLCILASINEIRFENILRFSRCTLSPPLSSTNSLELVNSSPNNIRILLGILTLPDQYNRRHFLRLVYGTQSRPAGTQVDVKFVFCNLTKEDQKVLVALEIMLHDDIIILNCKENMNRGKTYTFFSSLPDIFNSNDSSVPYPPYHYVMKGDDDTYFRLESLVESLRPLPRDDLYYGYVIPCRSMDPFVHYMSGMGYLISWDIVEWIKVSDVPINHLDGPEDQVFGDWMREGRRGKNRFNAKWSMYNFPVPHTGCTHELWPNTVAVHLLKSQQKWITTLNYFNVTRDLKPSKLYHIP
ncbi:beta-1,3-galactosyltransferase pvg3 [Apium graveolens]|uniref:beta-1,3-galactosyltransferase pvg3 n=1 Tax=Apium graveolens TaxID=4045 RepID=UPI003D78E988